MKKKLFLTTLLLLIINNASASIKNEIINKLEIIENISFNFEQNINGKIEKGNCIVEYPKKIYCEYNLNNKKILVSNGKSLVVKTLSSYYLYPIEKTPLNFILNKKFLLKKIKDLNERNIDDNFVNFNFTENDIEINLFFDRKTFNLIGWQITDIFQNINITYLSSIKRNQKIDKKLFLLPKNN